MIKINGHTSILLLNKLKQMRVFFAERGYSQSEFQMYLVTRVFGIQPHLTIVPGQCLTNKINSLSTNEQFEKLLQTIDVELATLMDLEKKKQQNTVIKNNIDQKIKEKEYRQLNIKNKVSKENREQRKERKTRVSKYRKRKSEQQLPLPLDSDNEDQIQLRDATILTINKMGKQYKKSSILKKEEEDGQQFYSLKLDSNQKQAKQEIQNQKIFQKLIEIQMISKLLCGGDLFSRQRNMQLMRVL